MNTKFAFACLAIVAASSGAFGKNPTLYYFKSPQTLHPISGQFAVRANSDSIRPSGWKASKSEPYPIQGWTMLSGVTTQPSAAPAFWTPVYEARFNGHMFPTQTILLGLEPTVSPFRAKELLQQIAPGSTVVEWNYAQMPGVLKVRTAFGNGIQVLDAAARLAVLPEVRYAEPDMITTGSGSVVPNDPLFSSAWGLQNTGLSGGLAGFDMRATQGWDRTFGNSTTLTVVIDTGVEQTHPDIRQIPGADFTGSSTGGNPVNSFDNHGTAVAGCISGIANNSIGACGVAPGTSIASARPFVSTNSSGSWTTQWSWTVDALAWAQSLGARVTNNSNLYGSEPSIVTDKYNQTYAAGMVHFAAAGNNNSVITYPAKLPNVNAVIAVNSQGNKASFSNFGVGADFSAPGESIITTDRTGSSGYVSGDYVFVNGTSFASPYASGVAAMVLGVNPYLTSNQVESVLIASARDLGAVGYDTVFGNGMVQLDGAMNEAASYRLFGSINFQGRIALRPTQVTLEIGGRTSVANLGVGQTFDVVAPWGSYAVRYRAPGYLSKLVNYSSTPGGRAVNAGSVLLLNGDIDQNNEIGPNDFALLAASFGLVAGDPGFNSGADLDGDLEVGPSDFSLLALNFGAVGD